MSYLAYLDKEKTNTIKANDAFLCFEKNKREYYCPNLGCTAKMTLKSRKGESSHYFAALPSFPHDTNCPYKTYSFVREDFDESAFSLDKLFASISKTPVAKKKYELEKQDKKQSTNTTLKTIKTIGQLYSMCINLDINDEYNDVRIWKILLDERSEQIYIKGICDGIRLIKCEFKGYKKEMSLIYLSSCNRFDLRIHISDELFPDVRNEMYKSRENKKSLIILGYWHKNRDYYISEITSKKQYKILG